MVDKDLLSIQEARALVRAARKAQPEFAQLSQERVDEVVKAVAEAAAAQAEVLANLAVEDTGFGRPQDKKIKNILASEKVYACIKDMKTIGVLHSDPASKVVEIAVPVGVIAGIVPSTNPTSTVIYKSLIALKSGNAIVFTPHPSARNCIAKTVEVIEGALRGCHVSPDLVSSISMPSIEGTNELMKISDLILATGGPGMVKAAYSSGTPALGVGAGNVPAYIERSADIEDAVSKIMSSKTFDNGTICASEQSIVTESCIADKVRATLEAQGGYFLTGEKLEKVKRVMERGNGSMNPAIVGRDALSIPMWLALTCPQEPACSFRTKRALAPSILSPRKSSRPCSAFTWWKTGMKPANCAPLCCTTAALATPLPSTPTTKKSSANSASKSLFRASWSTRPPHRARWASAPGCSPRSPWAAAPLAAARLPTTSRP